MVACLPAVLLGVVLECAAGVTLHESVQTYAIEGSTPQALMQQMTHHGPRHGGGRRSWAYTDWELQMHYVLEMSVSGCRLREPNVSLTLQITVPALQRSAQLSPAMRWRWQQAYEQIVAHEQTHRAHAHAAAKQMISQLRQAPAQPRCAVLERDVRRMLRDVSRQARRQSRAFDVETDYGALTGIIPQSPRQ